MENHLTGTWCEFEGWIREKIGADFRWRIRPQDTRSNREMVADLTLKDIQWGDGVFPDDNVFIERTKKAADGS